MTRRSVTHLLGFAVASLKGVMPTPLFADQGSEINSTLRPLADGRGGPLGRRFRLRAVIQ